MNNEQQTWILKHNLNPETMRPILLKNGWEEEYIEHFFEELFQPFDVAGLTRQVEESLTFLCQYAYDAGYTIGNDRTVTGKDVDLSVKATALEIVGLLLNQEGETK